jgi:hypothetical protein
MYFAARKSVEHFGHVCSKTMFCPSTTAYDAGFVVVWTLWSWPTEQFRGSLLMDRRCPKCEKYADCHYAVENQGSNAGGRYRKGQQRYNFVIVYGMTVDYHAGPAIESSLDSLVIHRVMYNKSIVNRGATDERTRVTWACREPRLHARSCPIRPCPPRGYLASTARGWPYVLSLQSSRSLVPPWMVDQLS